MSGRNDPSSYSQPTYDANTMNQYRAPDPGTINHQQYPSASVSDASTYDYSYSTDYYNQNQAPPHIEFSSHSQVSYSSSPAPTPQDSYYSYSTQTTPKAGQPVGVPAYSQYNTSDSHVSNYPEAQAMSGYGKQPQYQQAPYGQPQSQPAPNIPVSHGYDNFSHGPESFVVSSSVHSGGSYSYQTTADPVWSGESQYRESSGIYHTDLSATASTSYQQETPEYGRNDILTDRSNGSESFSSYGEGSYSRASGPFYSNENYEPNTNVEEPKSFQPKKQDFGGYSGPAPSSYGGWRRPGESSRGGYAGGPPARGRSSGYQDSRGSFGGRGRSGVRGGLQHRKEHRGASNAGNWRGGNNQSRGSGEHQATPHYGKRNKVEGHDVQNYMNEKGIGFNRSAGIGFSSGRGKLQFPVHTPNQNARPTRDDGPVYQTPIPRKKPEVFKAPSRPQDRLLNEIEEKAKAAQKKKTQEELKKEEEERRKAEEEKKRAEEEAQREALKRAEEERKRVEEEKKKAAEELREKLAEEAVKAAPPSKPPETPEEIAYEEEIQRKIRESVVVLATAVEEAPPSSQGDPTAELEMSDELRELLKTLTTQYLCKLCSVRIVGPQMAGMHYNGKNHLKKLRNFVQTNGRSAGFYLGVSEQKAEEAKDDEMKDGENKAEAVEITVMEASSSRLWWSGQG
ncbi:reticulocyte-binding protein 2 homolog a [Plakobranchus ocellatus]|uniref:Reticulocyte-binding protein 2 homolog a n=1 Tax=Plakobranchus ocellatus TaxID=259542 RepID=A0AAV3ZMN6_9GAST|nr:reticulocyte-binding protein 2 homolog a [Plakobranchus ocellatus]